MFWGASRPQALFPCLPPLRGGEQLRVPQLPEEVRGPHQGQVPGVHVGLAAEGGDVSQMSDQVFQGPVTIHFLRLF